MRIHQAIWGTAEDFARGLGLLGDPHQARKYFILSLHRSGTRSVTELLEGFGLRIVHWPVRYNGWKQLRPKIIGRETDLDTVMDVIEPVINKNDGLSDVPVPVLYRQLDERYPNAHFILVRRNTADWIRSVRRFVGDRPFDPYECVQYWHYLPARPKSLAEISDGELAEMNARHASAVQGYFARAERTKFAAFNLENQDTGKGIAEFIGADFDTILPHITDRPKRKRWYRRG